MAIKLGGEEDDLAEAHEINVTPFIDVMLVLLTIFMVAAPLATVDVRVELPASTAQPQPRPDEPMFLTVVADRGLALDDTPIAWEALGVGPGALRWGVCLSLVAAMHVGLAVLLLRRGSVPVLPAPVPEAVMLDLAPAAAIADAARPPPATPAGLMPPAACPGAATWTASARRAAPTSSGGTYTGRKAHPRRSAR